MIFRGIEKNETFIKLVRAVDCRGSADGEAAALLCDAVSDIVEEAELYSLSGDLWELFFALRLAQDESAFARAAEHGRVFSGSLAMLLWVNSGLCVNSSRTPGVSLRRTMQKTSRL